MQVGVGRDWFEYEHDDWRDEAKASRRAEDGRMEEAEVEWTIDEWGWCEE